MKNKKLLALFAAIAITTTCGTFALAQRRQPRAGEQAGERGGEHAGAPRVTEHAAEHADEGAEHAEDEGHEHGPAPLNWTDLSDKSRPAIVALVLNFAILIVLYYAMFWKGVVGGLKQRRVDIGKDIDDARRMLDGAKERAKKYQGDLKNADVDAATAKASLISAGKGEVERLLIEAEEKAERMNRDADRLVEQERKQLRQDMLTETIERAVGQAQKILERQATSEDHARLAQELLAELGRKPAAPRMNVQSVRPGGAS